MVKEVVPLGAPWYLFLRKDGFSLQYRTKYCRQTFEIKESRFLYGMFHT